MPAPPQIAVGDEVELRKPHACGTNRWRITRTGADIRLHCTGCGHTVLLSRTNFNRALRKLLSRASSEGQS